MIVTIRKATREDVPSCLEVQRSRNDSTFSDHNFSESLANGNAIFLVAEMERQVVGFILGFVVPTRNEEAMIHSTMVRVSSAKLGIGTKLVQSFAEHAFGDRRVKVIYAEVESGPDEFYRKCGFEKVFVWDSMRLLAPAPDA